MFKFVDLMLGYRITGSSLNTLADSYLMGSYWTMSVFRLNMNSINGCDVSRQCRQSFDMFSNYRKKNLPITANAAETKLRWMITKHVGYLSLL